VAEKDTVKRNWIAC